MVEAEKVDRRNLPMYWKGGKITVSGLLECLKHCSGYYGSQACCNECPGMKDGECSMDLYKECIRYLGHQIDVKRAWQKKYQERRRAWKAAMKAKQKK